MVLMRTTTAARSALQMSRASFTSEAGRQLVMEGPPQQMLDEHAKNFRMLSAYCSVYYRHQYRRAATKISPALKDQGRQLLAKDGLNFEGLKQLIDKSGEIPVLGQDGSEKFSECILNDKGKTTLTAALQNNAARLIEIKQRMGVNVGPTLPEQFMLSMKIEQLPPLSQKVYAMAAARKAKHVRDAFAGANAPADKQKKYKDVLYKEYNSYFTKPQPSEQEQLKNAEEWSKVEQQLEVEIEKGATATPPKKPKTPSVATSRSLLRMVKARAARPNRHDQQMLAKQWQAVVKKSPKSAKALAWFQAQAKANLARAGHVQDE
eukprot:JP446361.1.p1 GENE.JP446361.1~~JP446361.1.p1  ORF type:complete len:320 (-),score=125.67 JP446361.1:188-1147(-)